MLKKDYNTKKVNNGKLLKKKYLIKDKVKSKDNTDLIILLESLIFFVLYIIFSFSYLLTFF